MDEARILVFQGRYIIWEGDGLYGISVTDEFWFRFKAIEDVEAYIKRTSNMPVYIQEADLVKE